MGLEIYHFKLSDSQKDPEDYILLSELEARTNAKKEWIDRYTKTTTINTHHSIAIVDKQLYDDFEDYFTKYFNKVFFTSSSKLNEEISLYETENKLNGLDFFDEHSVVEKNGGLKISISLGNKLKGKKNSYRYKQYSVPTQAEVCLIEDAGYMPINMNDGFFNAFQEDFYYAFKVDIEKALKYISMDDIYEFKEKFVVNFEEGKSLISFGYD